MKHTEYMTKGDWNYVVIVVFDYTINQYVVTDSLSPANSNAVFVLRYQYLTKNARNTALKNIRCKILVAIYLLL